MHLVAEVPKNVQLATKASATDSVILSPALLASPTKQLPDECGTLELSSTNMVVLCRPVKESLADKLSMIAPSLIVSLLALTLSGFSLYYTLKKDRRARLQSVQDDFWLRKIVSPVSIEPFFKLSSEIINTLPDSDCSLDVINAWHRNHHTALLKLKPEFQALDLLSTRLFIAVDLELEKFEDLLAEYMKEIFEHVKNGKAQPLKTDTTAKLANVRHHLLHLILTHQIDLGSAKS